MLEVPDVDFIRPCGVVVFALFYCRLMLWCVLCWLSECFPIYVYVCFVCFMFYCVGELFVERVCICVSEMNVFSLKVIVLCCFCCWIIRVLSSKEYVCCVYDPSMCLDVPSICQFCVFV